MICRRRMVLASPGPLLTPLPSSSPPKTPFRSYSATTPPSYGNQTPPSPGSRGSSRRGRGMGGQNGPSTEKWRVVVRLGGAPGAGVAGAGGCAWQRWLTAGPLIVSSARFRHARPRRDRLLASSAQNPCSLPRRRTGEGLRRAGGGPGRVMGCHRLRQRRRVAAFLR
jgi:hypothetical protein